MTATTQLSLPDRRGLQSPFAALHHVALVTNDMAATVAFYRDVLGSEVAMAHRQGPDDVRHYFITVAPNTVFAFFEFPDSEQPEHLYATHPKSGRHLDHICMLVNTPEEWQAWKDRITAAGVPVQEAGEGRKSFFFPDPNNIVIEVSYGGGITSMPFPMHDDPDPAYEPPTG